MSTFTIDADWQQLLRYQPHEVLGLHAGELRVWRPGASQLWAEVHGFVHEMEPTPYPGLFRLPVGEATYQQIRTYHHGGALEHDPYTFWPTLGPLDEHLLERGCHYELYRHVGARCRVHQSVPGTSFVVWAPRAQSVSLVGDFNLWDPRMTPMRSLGACGFWEIFLPGTWEGLRYKFAVVGCDGVLRLKADPCALASEHRPANASVVARVDRFCWTDQEWMERRAAPGPLLIYEVHLGSWRRHEGQCLNYRALAPLLAEYCKQQGFTHVELLPIMEHPLDESWGYQVTGYFACTSRFGSPEDFQWFVNHLHQEGIGVILDWVPAHFPSDEHALRLFDGSAAYELADPERAWHPHWHTLCFDYGRREVSNFLIASALFWLEVMHVDGLRVDAVASMLYLDYGRDPGQWKPNRYGGHEHLEAVEFLRHCNAIIRERLPDVLLLAEESTAWPGVTHPVTSGGLGFTHKWNLGWMHDTLRYFAYDPLFRSHHQNLLTFLLLYAFTERFILPLSHDEVVHGKGSLFSKMPGDPWQQAANLRLLFSYQAGTPGPKLLFQGGELGLREEWDCCREMPCSVQEIPLHRAIQRCSAACNWLVRHHPALWEQDHSWHGFEWVSLDDTQNSVLAYLRLCPTEQILIIHHCTPQAFPDYVLSMPGLRSAELLLNTDREEYGGSGWSDPTPFVESPGAAEALLRCSLPPLCTLFFSVER